MAGFEESLGAAASGCSFEARCSSFGLINSLDLCSRMPCTTDWRLVTSLARVPSLVSGVARLADSEVAQLPLLRGEREAWHQPCAPPPQRQAPAHQPLRGPKAAAHSIFGRSYSCFTKETGRSYGSFKANSQNPLRRTQTLLRLSVASRHSMPPCGVPWCAPTEGCSHLQVHNIWVQHPQSLHHVFASASLNASLAGTEEAASLAIKLRHIVPGQEMMTVCDV